MSENPNQPREYDVVLGNQITPPANAAVLGGLAAVKKRLASPIYQQRIVALSEALKYGQPGLDLVIQFLQDESEQVHKAAYHLLRQNTHEPRVNQAIWEYNPYRFFECLATIDGHPESAVTAVTISADGKTLVSGGAFHDRTVKVWDLQSRQEIRTLGKHSNRIDALVLSPDANTLVSAGDDIKVWNLRTGNLIHTLKSGSGSGSKSIAVSPDWQTAFSGNWDGTISIWNLPTGKEICTIEAHRGSIGCLVLSSDGKTLFSGGNPIKIWETDTLREIGNLSGNYDALTSLALSPDGQTLASGSKKTIKLWHWQTGKEIYTINAHVGYVLSLVFSPDQKHLICGGNSDDNLIKFWNLQRREAVQILKGNQGGVTLALSTDGHTLVSGSYDIKIWGVW